MLPADYSWGHLFWIGLSVLILAMSKGGFPVGPIAVPALVLCWPHQVTAARDVVSFALPLLCVMDVAALLVFWRHVDWRRVWPLAPGALAGVALASLLFLADDAALFSLSDRWLKLTIGVVGVGFVAYQAARRFILAHLPAAQTPTRRASAVLGVAAGVTSTLAHAADPVAQMYFLPQRLDKMAFAATTAGFFFLLNLAKVVPFAIFGRFTTGNLWLALWMLPVVPVGVGLGYVVVRVIRGNWYVALIHGVLLATAVTLIVKALTDGG
ncbi:MAG: Sulfite exporter TauE/SafE [Lentisphaerae bacterium ADurb.BinA184]|nr:MAG: Sulfite exporter TauE/SafE [Lentisphaerae bacterium ADurb.BinA184]